MQIQNLIDRAQITDLITEYFRAIDDKKLDKTIVAKTFTIDAQIMKPNGARHVGHDAILDGQLKSFARFQATQHVLTDVIITFVDSAATLTANLSAMHIWNEIPENPELKGKHFQAGGILKITLQNENSNWLIRTWSFSNTWRIGDGLKEMAMFNRPATN